MATYDALGVPKVHMGMYGNIGHIGQDSFTLRTFRASVNNSTPSTAARSFSSGQGGACNMRRQRPTSAPMARRSMMGMSLQQQYSPYPRQIGSGPPLSPYHQTVRLRTSQPTHFTQGNRWKFHSPVEEAQASESRNDKYWSREIIQHTHATSVNRTV